MATSRSALIDLRGASGTDADVIGFLKQADDSLSDSELGFAPAPNAVTPVLGGSAGEFTNINTSCTVGTYLGRSDVIQIAEGSANTPAFNEAGFLFNDAIPGTAGKTIFLKFILTESADFLVSLQDVATHGLSLVHAGAVSALDYTALRFKAGGISVFRGLTETRLVDAPSYPISDPTVTKFQFPCYVGITFTSVGYIFRFHIPGVIDAPVVLHTEDRGEAHPAGGWYLAVNKWSDQNVLGVYDVAPSGPTGPFKSNIIVTGARIKAANTADQVQLGTLDVKNTEGKNIGVDGLLRVRFPTLDSAQFYTLDEVAALSSVLTGFEEYPIDFEVSGDVTIEHPVRITILDDTLTSGEDEVTGS